MMADPLRTGIARYLSDGWDGVAIRMATRTLFCGAVWWFFPFVGMVMFVLGTLREASHVAHILRRRTPSQRVSTVPIGATLEATIEGLGPIPQRSDRVGPSEESPPIVTGRGILATLALFWLMGVIWAVTVADLPVFEAAMQALGFAMFAPMLLGLLFGAFVVLAAFLGDPFIEATFAFGHLGAAALPRRDWRIGAHDAVDAKAEALVLWTRRPKDQPLFPGLAISRGLWLWMAGICTAVFLLTLLIALVGGAG